MALLERNERLVSWLQPKSGSIHDQIPAIRVKTDFYTISLRMMKAVWRHVRLRKGFVNREVVPHVGVRLRIPTLLLSEKIRTQQRFNVSGERGAARLSHGVLFNPRAPVLCAGDADQKPSRSVSRQYDAGRRQGARRGARRGQPQEAEEEGGSARPCS